jgi:uncharacterized protein (TIGR03118 family)
MKHSPSLQKATLCIMALVTLASISTFPLLADDYSQTNLVSNGAVPAYYTDPNLINPWGIASFAGGPFWASDQGAGKSTIINGAGQIQGLLVTIPQIGQPPVVGPTGIVFNSSTGFDLPGPKGSVPSLFIFSTLDGAIEGWNPASNGGLNSAIVATTVTGAVFTGTTLGTNNSGTYLFAANFASGKIDVFNSSFQQTTLSGNFNDPNLPSGYSPYNIQSVNGKLYVEYALVGSNGLPVIKPGDGIVDVFDTNGNLLQRLVWENPNLNVPWGVTMAPSGFGLFSNDLLVGNFGSGIIDAFNPTTGAFLGMIDNAQGQPLVNDFLWGLEFGTGGSRGGNPDTLYFNAGVDNQMGGLFGAIAATPDPASFLLLGIGLLGIFGYRRWRNV